MQIYREIKCKNTRSSLCNRLTKNYPQRETNNWLILESFKNPYKNRLKVTSTQVVNKDIHRYSG